ncbi:hypothetical protein ACPFL9_09560 [Paenarthrobacter sp. NyZ202]|uniref:hypothetical protein n=1 Tax=Paenarthrobacter sp. NyZ202 TaxID=3402689 RepID=UPI003CF8912B
MSTTEVNDIAAALVLKGHIKMTNPPTPAILDHGQASALGNQPCATKAHEWHLLVGQRVEIRQSPSGMLDRGVVEATTKDGQILWLALEGALSRRMYVKEPGIEAWITG